MLSIKNSVAYKSYYLLSKQDRLKLVFASILQASLGLLDVIGLISIGVLISNIVSNSTESDSAGRVLNLFQRLGFDDLSINDINFILIIIVVTSLTFKTLISLVVTRKSMKFLSRCGAKISGAVFSKLLSVSILKHQKYTQQELAFTVTRGVEIITLQILAPIIILFSDLVMLFFVVITLTLVDFRLTVISLIFLMLIGYFLDFYMKKSATNIGREYSAKAIEINEKVIEALSVFRELIVRQRQNFYVSEMEILRFQLADSSAEMRFIPYVSKYVIEGSLIIGASILGIYQFLIAGQAEALQISVIFLAAMTRMAPSMLRVQQSIIGIRTSSGSALSTLEIIQLLSNFPQGQLKTQDYETEHLGFIPEIVVSDLSFKYPDNQDKGIDCASFKVNAGSVLAIIGPSASGKTTLVDLILGILEPDSGEVKIAGLTPAQASTRWPGGISYVPQETVIINDTIRQNVTLGYKSNQISDEFISEILNQVALSEFTNEIRDLNTDKVGDRGSKLSGGQRQRLGIARALITRPKLLVLDEATSSLDEDTQQKITKVINELRGTTTVIIIAHRLSTIRRADNILYLKDGKAKAFGTLDEILSVLPEIERQIIVDSKISDT
jgi:ABC-type multidrug transport system fused ATPase/permease subunit